MNRVVPTELDKENQTDKKRPIVCSIHITRIKRIKVSDEKEKLGDNDENKTKNNSYGLSSNKKLETKSKKVFYL